MKKGWLVLLSVLVLLATGGIWWSFSRPAKFPGPFVLPDSNRVHLVAVTVGTNAKVHFGTPVERVLARLPGRLGKRFQRNEVSAISHRSAGAEILLWFRYDRPPPPGTYFRARLLESGEPLLTPWFSASPRTLSNGQAVAYCGTHLWPRRSRTLTFRLGHAQRSPRDSDELGEITVTNPAYQAYPVWTAENLPATRSFEGIDFTLERPIARRQMQVFVTSKGKPDPTWEVWGYSLRDATGNLIPESERQQQGPVRNVADHMGIVTLSTPMWYGMPKEPAWKLGMRFVRARALASEVFLLPGVPASGTGRRFSGTWTTNLPVGVVQLRYQLDWEDPSKVPCLVPSEAETVDLANGTQNLLAIRILGAVNDAGQKIEAIDSRKIHIPPGSTTLDITVAVPRQHFVEYVIDPKILTEPRSTPEYLRFPESVRPENILRDLAK